MNGVYTNLAKKRVEQSQEPQTQDSVPPLPEKPIVKKAQDKGEKPVTLQTRKAAKFSPCMFDGGPIFMEHGPVSWQTALPLVHQDRGTAWVASPSPWRARTVAWA